jgi:hypothetical protein
MAFLYFAIYYNQAVGQDLTLISTASCKIVSFLVRLTTQILSWLFVFLTIDRVVSIYYQNRFDILKNRTKLSVLMLIILILLAIINIPNFFYYLNIATSITNVTTNSTTSTRTCTADSNIVRTRDTIALVVRYVIPLTLTTILNVFLIYKLLKIKNRANTANTRDYIFALSVSGLNILFILSLLPNFMAIVYLNVIQYEQLSVIGSRKLQMGNLYNTIGILMTSLNNCLNIFVIFIFNRLFRKEFMNLIKEKFVH